MTIDFSKVQTAADRKNQAENDFRAQLSDIRWKHETGGLTLPDGKRVSTSRSAQMALSNAYQLVHSGLLETPVLWKFENGWFEMEADDIQNATKQVLGHVQNAFLAEQMALTKHEADTNAGMPGVLFSQALAEIGA